MVFYNKSNPVNPSDIKVLALTAFAPMWSLGLARCNFEQNRKGIYRIYGLCGHDDIRGTTMAWIVIVGSIYTGVDCNGRQQ